jgi:hypothetical protein
MLTGHSQTEGGGHGGCYKLGSIVKVGGTSAWRKVRFARVGLHGSGYPSNPPLLIPLPSPVW